MSAKDDKTESSKIRELIRDAEIFPAEIVEDRINYMIDQGLEDKHMPEGEGVDTKKFQADFKEDFKEYLDGERDYLSCTIDEAVTKLWNLYSARLDAGREVKGGVDLEQIIRNKLQETDYFQKRVSERREIRTGLHSILMSKLHAAGFPKKKARINATQAMVRVLSEMKEGGGKRKSKRKPKRKSRKSHKKKRKSNLKKSRKSLKSKKTKKRRR